MTVKKKGKGTVKKIGKKITIIIISVAMILILGKYAQYVYKCEKECVAYDTGGYSEPILFQDEIYFPSVISKYREWNFDTARYYGKIQDEEMYRHRNDLFKTLKCSGYLWLTDLWVDESDEGYTHVIRRGFSQQDYSKGSFLEQEERMQEIFEKNNSFMIIDSSNTEEKCCLIDKDLLLELEEKFGECEYYAEDFYEMKDRFYIFVNIYFEEGTNEDLKRVYAEIPYNVTEYMATIFMDESGTMYYCNRQNVIEGELLEKVNAVFEEGDMFAEVSRS